MPDILHRVTVEKAGNRTRLAADDSFQAEPYAIGMIRRVAGCATLLSAGLGQRDVHIAQLHSRRAGIGEGNR